MKIHALDGLCSKKAKAVITNLDDVAIFCFLNNISVGFTFDPDVSWQADLFEEFDYTSEGNDPMCNKELLEPAGPTDKEVSNV